MTHLCQTRNADCLRWSLYRCETSSRRGSRRTAVISPSVAGSRRVHGNRDRIVARVELKRRPLLGFKSNHLEAPLSFSGSHWAVWMADEKPARFTWSVTIPHPGAVKREASGSIGRGGRGARHRSVQHTDCGARQRAVDVVCDDALDLTGEADRPTLLVRTCRHMRRPNTRLAHVATSRAMRKDQGEVVTVNCLPIYALLPDPSAVPVDVKSRLPMERRKGTEGVEAGLDTRKTVQKPALWYQPPAS